MFNFLKKPKKAAKSKTGNKKADASPKRGSTSSQKSKFSPDQSMNLAAEKLESTIRNFNARGTANYKATPADKQKLINARIMASDARTQF